MAGPIPVSASRAPDAGPVRGLGVLPGFGLSLQITLGYLTLIVLLPIGALVFRAISSSPAGLLAALTGPRALAALKLTLGASFLAATINACFGVVVAWVLARYRFPGRALLDLLVDLPFALPTAVAGIAFASLYAEDGFFGRVLEPRGITVAFAPPGIVVVLIFVGLPFVVRAVEPVLRDLDPQVEEAAAVLGASRLRTMVSVVLPTLRPAVVTGFTMAFARGLGEYGSVVFISGNLPFRTEIVPLLIVGKLEQFDYAGASALGAAMLTLSLLLLSAIQAWERRRLPTRRDWRRRQGGGT